MTTNVKLTKTGQANKQTLYTWLKGQNAFKAFVSNLQMSARPSRSKGSSINWKDNYNGSLNDQPWYAIRRAFMWSNTPEGGKYWETINYKWEFMILNQQNFIQ